MNKSLKFKPKQLRNISPLPDAINQLKKNGIYIILDNIMDTYNIGGIFRLADAVSAKKIYLCGITATPPNTKIKKASVNTWQWVNWDYKNTAAEAIKALRQEVPTIKIIAVEQDPKSISFTKEKYQLPVALVVGHETDGISEETKNLCDSIVELPMFGVNSSLNVIVSLSIVAYKAIERNNIS